MRPRISRNTGHKYLKRYADMGMVGLKEMSRRPHSCPYSTDTDIEKLIIKERRLHATWGPKKIRRRLLVKHGIESPPALSTIGAILKKAGLVKRRRRKPGAYRLETRELTVPERPNQVWTVDFKGWLLLGNGQRCDPLTVFDLNTHYVIGCRALPNQQHTTTLRQFRSLMRYYGLPEVIRVDNGIPFASAGTGGLSKLSVWWISQGVAVEYTRPGCPQDNGSHERKHKDLKAEATKPPSANMKAQQRRFQRWMDTYNNERPHESLGMAVPSDLYRRSERRLNESDKVRYPEGYEVRLASDSGHIKLDGRSWHVGEAFAGQSVGLCETPKRTVELRFANMHLGNLAFGRDLGQFRPSPYIARPNSKSLDIIKRKKHK